MQINDEIARQLGERGYSGALNGMMYQHLSSLGYRGSLSDMLSQWGGLQQYFFLLTTSLFTQGESGVYLPRITKEVVGVENEGDVVSSFTDASGNNINITPHNNVVYREEESGLGYLDLNGSAYLEVGSNTQLKFQSPQVLMGIESKDDMGDSSHWSLHSPRDGDFVGAIHYFEGDANTTSVSVNTGLEEIEINGADFQLRRVQGFDRPANILFSTGMDDIEGSFNAGTINYSTNYPLTVGARQEGQEPWQGRLYSLIFAEGLPSDEFLAFKDNLEKEMGI